LSWSPFPFLIIVISSYKFDQIKKGKRKATSQSKNSQEKSIYYINDMKIQLKLISNESLIKFCWRIFQFFFLNFSYSSFWQWIFLCRYMEDREDFFINWFPFLIFT
jgi:hypothetical protein